MIRLFLIIAGPGIIVMVADNDAGGITTYTATGAKYGFHLIWFLILLGPVAYYVQEMTVRLGAVTKRGHAEAIFHAFGSFLGMVFPFGPCAVELADDDHGVYRHDGGTQYFRSAASRDGDLGSDFDGDDGDSGAVLDVGKGGDGVLRAQSYLHTCRVHDPPARPSRFLQGCLIPQLPPGGFTNELFFFLMANIGTTIAPWMIFFQQSAVVDKSLQEKDITGGKVDTGIGAFFTVVVAAFCVILTGTLLPGQNIYDAGSAAAKFMGTSKQLGTFLAIGLFDAGFLGAICISLASSWAFGEVFGWAHSLNNKVKEAPWFYAYYFFGILLAGTVVLIPRAPLVLITLFVQVIAVTLAACGPGFSDPAS